MAERRVYRGSIGPEIYDDQDTYPNSQPFPIAISTMAMLFGNGYVRFSSDDFAQNLDIEHRYVQLDDGDTHDLLDDMFGGKVVGFFWSDIQSVGIFAFRELPSDDVALLQDPWSEHSTTQGNSGTINVYPGGTVSFQVENLTGNSINLEYTTLNS